MIIDLSHPITNDPPCTFSSVEKVPIVYFEEGDSHGEQFITSRIDNLYSNLCTHIDFPGHIPKRTGENLKEVGKYPVERFYGQVVFMDVSSKIDVISHFFDDKGLLTIDLQNKDEISMLVGSLDSLEISVEEVKNCLSNCQSDVIGLVLYSSLSNYWVYKIYESWQYIYFYNTFFSREACEYIVEKGLSFVGVDAFQLEHPIINFNGDERLFANVPDIRSHIHKELINRDSFRNHDVLLGSDILIYENLRVPEKIAGRTGNWSGAPLNLQLNELNDNALCRPIVEII